MSRGDPAWFPFVGLAMFIAISGIGLTIGWLVVRRRERSVSFLLMLLAAALAALGLVGIRADLSGSAFGESLGLVGLPLATGFVIAATTKLLVGAVSAAWPIARWAAVSSVGIAALVLAAGILFTPPFEEVRGIGIRRLDTPDPGALVLEMTEVEAISPAIAAGFRAAPSSWGFVNVHPDEAYAFWSLIDERRGAPQSEAETTLTIDDVGYVIAPGPV